ncbi:DUF3667 domain-containing protein [Chitinophaga agrisoli]|uniref:DUF3667 domain-containing protein n=1 Tax=Chitinophaga agrisoli TaxID=2607653 RepID=UPI001BC95639|nr:DUF3667 domain-containing protein [Chitinophaga agrisoli]
MKTQHLRQDKHCLNCGTEVPERYCTHCGQENTVPHESFGHLVKHFVGDVLHYDSQFLVTLKYLLFRPGKLTKEYMAGRRVSYVNPVKLYIFISFVFFLTMAMLSHSRHTEEAAEGKDKKETGTRTNVVANPRAALEILSAVNDSVRKHAYDGMELTAQDSAEMAKDTATAAKRQEKIRAAAVLDPVSVYGTKHHYDSVQNALPKEQRDNWSKRLFIRRALYLHEHYQNGDFMEDIKHNYPKMMFLLLPLFALWLKVVYNWKRWYYTDHAIFSLHFHCFAFVVMFIGMLLDYWFSDSDPFMGWALIVTWIYLLFALRNTYSQSFRRSLAKAVALTIGYGITFGIIWLLMAVLVLAVIL